MLSPQFREGTIGGTAAQAAAYFIIQQGDPDHAHAAILLTDGQNTDLGTTSFRPKKTR